MKSLTWLKWKPILILIVYLAFVVVWGSLLAIMIIEESEAWAIVWLISSVLVLFGAFLIEGYSNGYKWKYYFLGKNFKKQRDEFFKNHEKVSKKEKRKILKDMKNTYRRFGFVDYAVDDYVVTPIKLYYEDFVAFNYGNALTKQKVEYITYGLYSRCLTGGGLYRFLEDVAEEPFSYEEYVLVVKSTDFSKKLKELLLNKDCKKAFECLKKENELSEKEHEFLEGFELNGSNGVYEFETEIFDKVKSIAMNKFFDYHRFRFLPNNAKRVFMSKDNMKRISICFIQNLNSFNIVRDEFVFFDTGAPEHQSEGGWCEHAGMSYYETEQLAINDIKNEIKDYIELKDFQSNVIYNSYKN